MQDSDPDVLNSDGEKVDRFLTARMMSLGLHSEKGEPGATRPHLGVHTWE